MLGEPVREHPLTSAGQFPTDEGIELGKMMGTRMGMKLDSKMDLETGLKRGLELLF
jgi:hypothetical protein